METPSRESTSRQAFHHVEGFALYTDINACLLDSFRDFTPPKTEFSAPAHDGARESLSGIDLYAGTGLYAVSSVIERPIAEINDMDVIARMSHISEKSGIDEKVFQGVVGHTYQYGIGDMTFPWHFTTGIANAVVQEFVGEGKISQEDYKEMALRDWSDMLRTGWFSGLMHSLAYAPNGYFGRFGAEHQSYLPGGLRKHIRSSQHTRVRENVDIFDVTEKQEPFENNRTYLVASLNRDFKKEIRSRMREQNDGSIGCPVARRSVVMDGSEFRAIPSVKRLIDRDILTSSAENPTFTQRVVVEQQETALDRTLWFIADQIDRYDEMHGTPVPYINEDWRVKMSHKLRTPTKVLYRD